MAKGKKGKRKTAKQKREERVEKLKGLMPASQVNTVDAVGFAVLWAAFYYGFNPAILNIIEALLGEKGVVKTWFNVSFWYLDPAGTQGMIEDQFRIKAKSQEDAEEIISYKNIKKVRKLRDELALERKKLDLLLNPPGPIQPGESETLGSGSVSTIGVGQITDPGMQEFGREQRERDIQRVQDNIARMEKDISSLILTPKERDELLHMVDWMNMAAAGAEAASLMWFLKSYTFSDLIENATITG